MAWVTINPRPQKGPARLLPMGLRVFSPSAGNLSQSARRFLFDGAATGLVQFQREDGTGLLSVIAVDRDGYSVLESNGRVFLGSIKGYAEYARGKTIALSPDGEADGMRRLVFGGVK